MSNDITLPTPPVGWELLKVGDKIKQGGKYLSYGQSIFSENIRNWQRDEWTECVTLYQTTIQNRLQAPM